jgi:hypothetical protein
MRYKVELRKTLTASVLVEAETDIDAFDEARFLADKGDKWGPALSGVEEHVRLLSDSEWTEAKADEKAIAEGLEEMCAEFEKPGRPSPSLTIVPATGD